jgi:proteasome lid subunit RPN8/RPN11
VIEEIREHFEKEYPREACGIIGIVKGKKKWFPCENVAEDDDTFILSSDDWFEVKKKADIYAIVHNHPDESNEASEHDINSCNAMGVLYYIFSYPDMELNIVEPEERNTPLIGREYEFGKADCFEAMRDWLASKDINIPPRAAFEDYWWEKDLNYFTEETISQWGFVKVEEPKENDLLIFQISENVPDHCGVYLGNDIFFHHAENRLSCREHLYPLWGKKIVGIYRHDA